MGEPRRHVLVTGASRGIGEAIARELGRAGRDLYLVARTEGDLRRVAGEIAAAHPVCDIRTAACDLADPKAREGLIRRLDAEGIALGGLVNNAGIGSYGRFERADPAESTHLVRLNIEALTHLAHVAAVRLRGVEGAFILNVASLAGFQPVPYFAVYAASKAYVLSLSEALAHELAPHGIRVTALCPGFVATGFQAASGMVHAGAGMGEEKADVAEVARCAVRAVERGRTIAIPTLSQRLMVFAERFAPRSLVAAQGAAMMRKVLEADERGRPA